MWKLSLLSEDKIADKFYVHFLEYPVQVISQHLSNTIPIFFWIWYTNTVNKLLSLL